MLANIFWTLLTICGICACGIALFVMAYIVVTFVSGCIIGLVRCFVKSIKTKNKED